MKEICKIVITGVVFCSAIFAVEPNPPTWPASVFVFSPSDSAATINAAVNTAYMTNGGQNPPNNGEFSSLRFAFLFKPNTLANPTYAGVSVPVGFYTSVIGLGKAPSDTQIPDVFSEAGSSMQEIGALDTFWRSAENFATSPSRLNGIMQWAVSQAAPLRRIQFPASNIPLPPPQAQQGIQLFEGNGFASGGFMADCNVSPTAPIFVNSGPQQQWLSRNCNMAWEGAVWNMVFVGCTGSIPSTTTDSGYFIAPPRATPAAITNVTQTPVIAEKPYITFDTGSGKYFLQIPGIEFGKTGPTTDFNTNVTTIDFANVYVVTDPANETAATINQKIKAGNHIILTPGIYQNLGGPIVVAKPDSQPAGQPLCILGIGFPTLIAAGGQSCIQVRDDTGGAVRIGGILLQAGPQTNPLPAPLLQWGQSHTPSNVASFLYDCFARVGGPADPSANPTAASTMVEINNDNVICDNAWLWRADHWSTMNGTDNPVVNSQNPCVTGLRVNGDNVIAYGLAVEHTLGNLVEWNGNNGSTYFFQAEYPYDVTQANYGDPGFAAYKVFVSSDPAFTHNAFGLGVYCFFRDNPVTVKSGTATVGPLLPSVQFTNVLTKYLTGMGGITNVINGSGNIVQAGSGPQMDDVSCVASYTPANNFFNNPSRRGRRGPP